MTGGGERLRRDRSEVHPEEAAIGSIDELALGKAFAPLTRPMSNVNTLQRLR